MLRDIEFYIEKQAPQTIKVRGYREQGSAKIVAFLCSGTYGVLSQPEDAKDLVKILNGLSQKAKQKLIK